MDAFGIDIEAATTRQLQQTGALGGWQSFAATSRAIKSIRQSYAGWDGV